jgi:rubrerythrin
MLLWHEYCECYLYWSAYKTECDEKIKKLWEMNLDMEIGHLHKAAELLKKYEKKEWQQVISDGEFPAPISLHENVEYVRTVLKNTVNIFPTLQRRI